MTANPLKNLHMQSAVIVLTFLCSINVAMVGKAQMIAAEGALERYSADLKFLAADELKGRLPGSPEMDQAADYLIERFKEVGLSPGMPDGSYLQPLDVGRTRALVSGSATLVFNGPDNRSITADYANEFTVQMCRSGYEIEGDLFFVGYGITAEELNFDEYAGIDVTDKIVVMIRREPSPSDKNSVFSADEPSQYASIRNKCSTVRSQGAKAIIFVNDSGTAPDDERDELAAEDLFGASTFNIPFIHLKRSAFDRILEASPIKFADGKRLNNLAAVEKSISETLESHSQPLSGWTAKTAADFARKPLMTNNVIAVLEGEGPLADETIVIGGHYDHLGLGAFGSRSPDAGRKIHNGADDNATGTVAVVELARRYATRPNKPSRRMVFMAFTAEEMGLLGAQHYVANPIFPLDNTVAMINFDMIGSLRDENLTIYSTDSAPEFAPIVDKHNEEFKFNLNKPAGAFGASDHFAFQQKGIPVMFFHTGLTPTYHTPGDTFDTINLEGAVKVVDYTEKVIDDILAMQTRPTFSSGGGGRSSGVRLGATLEDGEQGEVFIVEITEGSLADKAGFKVGDRIKKIDDKEISRRREVNREVAARADKKAVFLIDRNGQEQTIEVELKN
jgi:hypothetical protein